MIFIKVAKAGQNENALIESRPAHYTRIIPILPALFSPSGPYAWFGSTLAFVKVDQQKPGL